MFFSELITVDSWTKHVGVDWLGNCCEWQVEVVPPVVNCLFFLWMLIKYWTWIHHPWIIVHWYFKLLSLILPNFDAFLIHSNFQLLQLVSLLIDNLSILIVSLDKFNSSPSWGSKGWESIWKNRIFPWKVSGNFWEFSRFPIFHSLLLIYNS